MQYVMKGRVIKERRQSGHSFGIVRKWVKVFHRSRLKTSETLEKLHLSSSFRVDKQTDILRRLLQIIFFQNISIHVPGRVEDGLDVSQGLAEVVSNIVVGNARGVLRIFGRHRRHAARAHGRGAVKVRHLCERGWSARKSLHPQSK